MRIFNLSSQDEIKKLMRDIGVDPYGCDIMLPKAVSLLILLKGVNNIAANIIKQETLSLGADAAVAKGALTGKTKITDVLMMGTLAQFKSLASKLKCQPFGLSKLGSEIEDGLKNYFKKDFILRFRKNSLNLSKKTGIMGIINLTPDSFSGDGLYKNGSSSHIGQVLEKARQMEDDGADIIDLGGQSSRPGAKIISSKEELKRVIPAVKALAKKTNLPISIDTLKPVVAQAALDAGAQIINDISGLRNNSMLKLAAKYKATVVIMHMLGRPVNMQKIISYRSLIEEIATYLKNAILRAENAGIKSDKIIIDPGIGFGKTPEHNLQLIKRIAEFKLLGKPILAGLSRKSFIGKILGNPSEDRLYGTLAGCVIAQAAGCNILRVHDVKEVNQSLKIAGAIKNAE